MLFSIPPFLSIMLKGFQFGVVSSSSAILRHFQRYVKCLNVFGDTPVEHLAGSGAVEITEIKSGGQEKHHFDLR